MIENGNSQPEPSVAPAIPIEEVSGDDVQAFSLAGEVLYRAFKWIMHGNLEQRSLRLHVAVLCISPHVLPCQKPSLSWCARIHGGTRQWAHQLVHQFLHKLGVNVFYRGRQFVNL